MARHCQIPTDVINKIAAMSPPTNKKETQPFWSVVGFCRMHIQNTVGLKALFVKWPRRRMILNVRGVGTGWSIRSLPTQTILWFHDSMKWGPEQWQAFEQVKQEIVHAVALGAVQTGQDVKSMLYTAAGENGPTWCLWQKTPGETRGWPLRFWGQEYQGSKSCYTLSEKEVSAAYEGV